MTYKAVRIPDPRCPLKGLEFALGAPLDCAVCVHVRGTYGGVAFAGSLLVLEGRTTGQHDLKSYGQPLDLDGLAELIDEVLSEEPAAVEAFRRACE